MLRQGQEVALVLLLTWWLRARSPAGPSRIHMISSANCARSASSRRRPAASAIEASPTRFVWTSSGIMTQQLGRSRLWGNYSPEPHNSSLFLNPFVQDDGVLATSSRMLLYSRVFCMPVSCERPSAAQAEVHSVHNVSLFTQESTEVRHDDRSYPADRSHLIDEPPRSTFFDSRALRARTRTIPPTMDP